MRKKKVMLQGRGSEKGLASDSDRRPLNISIVARLQTLDEQHRFKAATDALLTELVRRRLGRMG